MKAEELREIRALMKETVERVPEIQRDAGAMVECLWEAKAKLDRYVGG